MRARNTSGLILWIILSSAAPLYAQSGPSGFHKAQEIVLGGDGGWDLLTFDADARRLYISRSTRVIVVDADSGKEVGSVADTPGVHAIAMAPELDTGYTSNGRDGSVTVFDRHTLQSLARIPVGTNPDAILYEPTTKRVFAFNGGSHDVSVIDAQKRSVVRTLRVDGKPELAVADRRGAVYLNLEDTSEVLKINANLLTIEARWPLAPCEHPTGISMDDERRRLFVGCANHLMAIVDADQGGVVATLPIGARCDGTAFDPQLNLAFSSNGDGTVTVVRADNPDKYSVVENVVTKIGARTMALDLRKQRIYLVTSEFGPLPAATENQPNPRPPMVPGTFTLLVLTR